ncbi:ribokinase [Salmonella enterica subsp. diarizonae]|uniref:PfkB family carbohydrate kinase n=1 Tax=Salmonella enterica TaxID=28901 RepID=UPI001CF34386|nr:ribokinase [Salmonella enterica subsp. diarizonae]
MFNIFKENIPTKPVVIIGAAFADMIINIDKLPYSGDDISAREGGIQIGGCAFNVARALARLELNPIAAIPVGCGEWGARVEREMRDEGLNVILRHPVYDNGWCLAIVESSKERTFITIEGCEQYWTEDMLENIPLPDNSIIYVSGYELTSDILCKWILKLSFPHKLFIDFGPKLVDFSRTKIQALLQKKPILTLNRTELNIMTNTLNIREDKPLKAAKVLSDKYDIEIICRFDSEGACVFEPGKDIDVIPACKVKVHDTIAAGDSHCAGVIAGMAYDMGLSEATKLGNEVAAIVVSRPGAGGAPYRHEFLSFINKTI